MFELIFAHGEKGGEEQENIEDKRMFDELADYIVARDISSKDIEEAYFRLCGVVDSCEPSDVVRQLQEKMQLMTEQRFPLNRFVELIKMTGRVEDGEKDFYVFVDGLDITINEKEVLKSIVLKMRSGELSISTERDHELLSTFTIDAKNVPRHFFGFMLNEKIKEVLARVPQEEKFEFSFEEK